MPDYGTAPGKRLPGFHKKVDLDIAARIAVAVEKIGSAVRAGEIAGVSDEAIGRWSKGGSKPPFNGVIALCRAAEIRVEWLATGEGPRDIHPADALPEVRTHQEQVGGSMVQQNGMDRGGEGMVLLPRLSVVASAGQGIVPADEEIEEFLALKAEYLREIGVNPPNAHVLQIKGGSMYPTFRDGDVIVIDASLIEVLDEGFYTIVYGGAVFAKRIQPLRDGSLRIVSDNKTDGYVDEIVPASERHTLKIVGRIRGVYRNL